MALYKALRIDAVLWAWVTFSHQLMSNWKNMTNSTQLPIFSTVPGDFPCAAVNLKKTQKKGMASGRTGAFSLSSLTFLLGLLLLTAGPIHAAPLDTKPIHNAISVLINQFSDGHAVSYPEFRKIHFTRLFDDEADSAIAFFSIEGFDGGNYHAEYMAVFAPVSTAKKARPYRLIGVTQIGGRGWRTFDWRSLIISEDTVTISGMAWQDKDPSCCPSAPINITFQIQRSGISER